MTCSQITPWFFFKITIIKQVCLSLFSNPQNKCVFCDVSTLHRTFCNRNTCGVVRMPTAILLIQKQIVCILFCYSHVCNCSNPLSLYWNFMFICWLQNLEHHVKNHWQEKAHQQTKQNPQTTESWEGFKLKAKSLQKYQILLMSCLSSVKLGKKSPQRWEAMWMVT